MKKIILIIFFFFISFITKAQNPNQFYLTDEQKYYNEVVYIRWTPQYPVVNCMPSFYWSVTRSRYANNWGQFEYKMYFRTNSTCNGFPRAVQINGILLYVNGQIMNLQTKYWIRFLEIYQPPTLSFMAPLNPVINYTWDNVILN